MTDYIPPLKDIMFNVHALSGLERVLGLNRFAEFDKDLVDQVVDEAGKFAADILSPLNIPGDRARPQVVDKGVISVPGFAEAYSQFVENGWQSLVVSPEYGGMGMPGVAGAAAAETWQAACLSFMLAPMLTSGAIHCIEAHGSESIRNTYLPNMTSGGWTGTMNLTEPQAGSDLSVVTTKAVPEGDHYRITGSKIFITWGDQDFSENIIHLVLARLPDAPEGVRGISLFLVPKFLLNADGSIGERNDVYTPSVEHKLGIHASPTCVMAFGEQEGAVGYLVGEENKGLACMFTMMNHARLGVGMQGLGISERAYQLARSYALDRKQGRAPGVKGSATIIHHPDIRRMLLVMKSQIEAMRAAAFYTAGMEDLWHYSDDEAEREAASTRVALLTPVIKAWLTEVAQELTSLGVQIQGGMGYVEETGAAQHMRDARILTIYEGTTGIQAIDFVGRKILADEGKAIGELIAEMRSLDDALAADERLADIRTALAAGIDQLESAADWLLEQGPLDPNAAGSASVNLLMLAGTVVGGWQMARAGIAVIKGAASDDAVFANAKLSTVRFYALHIMPRANGLAMAAMAGADAVMALDETQF
ncbi:MAG: acyl-CoA dehydrogenase [Gammaproteobacteria bacterium]|nr:acyl-CoA dehydrogenase [Gammaproteobacteria bacterium]MDH5241503.1 acyl-CoA dehydrogenase [Gammaproteobacteria bacterium]MDH5261650.1 acyl-CoA dehydrogenase [Gammaproteobacteria bacterium]